MTYSKTHRKFSDYLEQPDALWWIFGDALKNPEKYLGPNWEDVLNFWIYLDTLSDLEMKEMYDLYWALDDDVGVYAEDAANNAAKEVVGGEIRSVAWWAVVDVTGWAVFGFATEELIGSHKLLEQNKTPTFLPLCIKS